MTHDLSATQAVVIIGGANMDIVAHTDTRLRLQDSNPGHIHCCPGGVARNVAENLARLGADTRFIGAVGDDVFGQSLSTATRAAGVNVAGLQTLAGQRTATYLSLHGPDGDMSVALNDMAILECVTPDGLAQHTALLHAAACVVLDCNLAAAALAWLLHQPSAAVFVDGVSVAKCQRITPWLSRIHTLKVNAMEAQALTDMHVPDLASAEQAALRLHHLGVANVVVSLGAQGLAWCNAAGQGGQRPPGSCKVVNTSGAGDALLAGLVYSHLLGQPLAQAVQTAMACAEITLGSPFANHPQLSSALLSAQLQMQL